jgi:hypothetical protein
MNEVARKRRRATTVAAAFGRLDRNYLLGADGDAINAFLSAAGHNLPHPCPAEVSFFLDLGRALRPNYQPRPTQQRHASRVNPENELFRAG